MLCWQIRQRPSCTRMMTERYGDRKNVLRIQSIPPHQWNMMVVMYWRRHVVWLPLDDRTADKSIMVNSEVSSAIVSVHVQTNTSELVRRHFQRNVLHWKCKLPEAKFRCLPLVQSWRDLTVVVVWMEAQKKIILTKMEALCINNCWKINSS